MPNVRLAETFTGRWERVYASGAGPTNGTWWSRGLCRCQETPDPARTSLAEAGLAQPSKASFWHLLFLGGSWKTLPSVLTMFWVFHLVCGSRRRLPGGGREPGQSSLDVPEGSFPLRSSLTPGAGPRAHCTGWHFPVGSCESAEKREGAFFKGRNDDF